MATTLAKFFFRAPFAQPSTLQVWRWWEQRRLAYNLAIFAAGATTVGVVYLLELATPGRARFPNLLVIGIYALLANLFYTLGPIADTLISKAGGGKYSEIGPLLFRYGFVSAILLTLLPIPVVALRILLGFVL